MLDFQAFTKAAWDNYAQSATKADKISRRIENTTKNCTLTRLFAMIYWV
jgi:hypothetical protein